MVQNITEYFELPRPVSGNQYTVQLAYYQLSNHMNSLLIEGPEKSVALRKLLESFDAAMRAAA